MSTVSGGGYFGSFFGRLFTRSFIRGVEDVNATLNGTAGMESAEAETRPHDVMPGVLHWLRENGCYLSPRGAGDVLTMLAGIVRNWAAMHVTLLSVILLAVLCIVLTRTLIEGSVAQEYVWLTQALCISPRWGFWLSPLWIVTAAIFMAFALPAGWAYWLLEWPSPEPLWKRARKSLFLVLLVFGLAALLSLGILRSSWYAHLFSGVSLSPATSKFVIFLFSASLIVAFIRIFSLFLEKRIVPAQWRKSPYSIPPAFGVAVVMLALGCLYANGQRLAAWLGGVIVLALILTWAIACGPGESKSWAVFSDARARNRLTYWLRVAFQATGVALVKILDTHR